MAFHPIRCAVQRERSFPASAGRYALTAALRGSGLLRAAGSDRLFRRGDVALLPPGLSHSCVSTDKLEICSFFFAPDEVIAPQADLRLLAGYRRLFAGDAPVLLRLDPALWPEAEYALDAACSAEQDQQPGCRTLQSALLACLLVLLVRQAEKPDGAAAPETLAAAIHWMETHFAEEITLEQLSALAGMSPRHFDRLFRLQFGVTPKEYMTRLRIAQARFLLLHSEKAVTEIAFDCGYADSNYFARVFRRLCGMSPLEYRKKQ